MRTRFPSRLCSIALFTLSVITGTAATFRVVNANDDGAGTLRQAILDANTSPGIDTIAFNIPLGGGTSITLTGATFVVTDPVVIDGTTQPGFAGIPVVELTSSFEAPWLQCLQIEAGNSVVRGLSFRGLKGDAVILKDGGTNVIEGNMFGLRRDGVSSHGNAYRGIILINSSFNTIGGTNAAQRNVVAASGNAGINLLLGSSNNRIIGNYVGTDVTGTKPRGNYRGITITVGTNNVIGGAGPGERNIISGSGWTGVQLWIGESNCVIGNYIGTDVTGRFALTNYDVGIYVAPTILPSSEATDPAKAISSREIATAELPLRTGTTHFPTAWPAISLEWTLPAQMRCPTSTMASTCLA